MRTPLPQLLLLLLLFGVCWGADETEQIDEEDIVRLFVSGTTSTELIDLINSNEVDFDLSSEMLEELSLAGLPASVIQAMIDRQPSLERGPTAAIEPEPPAVKRGARSSLTISLEVSNRTRPLLRLEEQIPQQLFDNWRLRDPASRFSDLALFLGCLNPLHVPDHWRSKTPLGRDFHAVPRHRLLTFIAGAQRKAAGRPKKARAKPEAPTAYLELQLPDAITAELEAGVAHSLILGIAVQVGDLYYLLTADEMSDLLPGQEMELSRGDHGL